MKQILFFLLLIISILIFQSCRKEPVACFDISKNTLATGDTLNFSFCSLNDNSCKWDFGDGTSSTLERPVKIYDTAGTFRIILTVFSQGRKNTDTLSKIIIVNPRITQPPSIQIIAKDLISLDTLSNINIILFSSFSDWQNLSNPIATGLIDNTKKITFNNLNATQYYIRAENATYTNYGLGNANIIYILTDTLKSNQTYQFTAWVQSKPAPPTALQVMVKTIFAPQSPVTNINVTLFASYSDWQTLTNPVANGQTNSSGIVTFNSNINPVKYFIRAQNGQYSNHLAGVMDSNNVITGTLLADTMNYYTAYVNIILNQPTSLRITVKTAFLPQNFVPNINVALFSNYSDWQNITNPVATGVTNSTGIVTFNTNLNPVQYYVRVENSQLSNVQAGMANQNNVKTNTLIADTANYYTAFVDQNTLPPTALQIDVRQQGGMPPQQPVPNITVTLYNNYNDWLNQTSPVMSGVTNFSGFVVFTSNLSAVQYYVRAENLQFTNLAIGQMNQNNVLTPVIILYQQNFFTAFVKPPVN